MQQRVTKSDFLLKTYTPGQDGPPEQQYSDPYYNWSAPMDPIGGGTTQTPAIITYGQQFWVVALGTDQQIYDDIWNPPTNSWLGWTLLPYYSGGFSSAPTVAVYNGIPVVFVRGNYSHIWQSSWIPGSGWTNWIGVSSPYSSASAPAVTTYTGNNDRNKLQLWWLDGSSSSMMQMDYNPYGGPANQWIGP